MTNTFTALAYHRAHFLKQRRAGHQLEFTEYGWLLGLAMRRTLHSLAQRERDLRVVSAYRDMLAAESRMIA